MKNFLIIAPQTAFSHKVSYKLFLNHNMKCGFNEIYFFNTPEFTNKRVQACCWLHNFDIYLPFYPIKYSYIGRDFKKFDNYDAIFVENIKEIPYDYDGVMGVSIHFMLHYNPNQFKIIKFRKGVDGKDLRIDGKEVFQKVLIKRI